MILIPTTATGADGAYDDTSADSIYADNSYNADSNLYPVMLIIQAILIQTVLMPVKLMSPTVHTAQTVLITDNSYSEDTTADVSL